MNRILLFTLFLSLWSSMLCAEANYRGLVVAHIVEPNGHIYRGEAGLLGNSEFKDKQIVYLSQERGQMVALSDMHVLVDSSTQNKYYVTLNIIERVGDKFTAELKVFRNAMEFQEKNQQYALVSHVIKTETLQGLLNSENRYTLVDDQLPNIKVSVNIDRIFSPQEIRERLENNISSR